MHFPVCIALFVICSTLIEAVPTPQIQSIRGRWRPKVIREKEAAAAAAAAREAEKAAAVTTEGNEEPAPAAREDEQVAVSLTQIINQVVEDVTEIAQEAVTATMEVIEREEGSNSSLSTTDGKSSSLIVTDEPLIHIDTTVVSGQKDIVENTTEIIAPAIPTSENNSTGMLFSINKVENPVEDKNTCRLSLRGKSCTCHFEKTCRCDCGRIFSANTKHAVKSVRPTPPTNNRENNSRRKIQRFQFPQSNKH